MVLTYALPLTVQADKKLLEARKQLPPAAVQNTGEEKEETLVQLNARLYCFVKPDAVASAGSANTGVPPAASDGPGTAGETKGEAKSPDSAEKEGSGAKSSGAQPAGVWQERGRGLLKVNRTLSEPTVSRLVMRQNDSKRLCLNAPVWSGIVQRADNQAKPTKRIIVNVVNAAQAPLKKPATTDLGSGDSKDTAEPAAVLDAYLISGSAKDIQEVEKLLVELAAKVDDGSVAKSDAEPAPTSASTGATAAADGAPKPSAAEVTVCLGIGLSGTILPALFCAQSVRYCSEPGRSENVLLTSLVVIRR